MQICIPVNDDNGLNSTVCAHFGSAPLFMIVDSDTNNCRTINNQNEHHNHGMCTPLQSLQGENLDAIVVGGIGMGALNKLKAAGLEVYLADKPNVAAILDAFKAGTLSLVQPGMACAGHGGGHGHQHGSVAKQN